MRWRNNSTYRAQKKILKVVQDVETRWNGQFYMVVRLLQLKEPTVTVLSRNKKDHALNLSNDQRDLAEDLVSVLRDLELVTTRLTSELLSHSITAPSSDKWPTKDT